MWPCHSFTFIVAHSVHTYFNSHFFLLLCLSHQEACNKWCCVSICCVWMSYYFFLHACFDWVCKAICHSESSIMSPAIGSHSFEWIKPGQSTGIHSVCLLKSCIHTSKLHDYSYFNQEMSHVPSLSPASQKAVTMDEVYLFKDGTNKFTTPPGKQPNRQFRI